jgi:hypothetical protein
VIAKHVDGLAVRDTFEVLQEANTQEHDWFDGSATRALGIGCLDLGSGGDDSREDQLGEEAVAIGFREEGGRDGGKGKEGALGGEGGRLIGKAGEENEATS